MDPHISIIFFKSPGFITVVLILADDDLNTFDIVF